MKRRDFIAAGGAAVASLAFEAKAQGGLAPPQDITPLIRKITGGGAVEKGGVEIDLPQFAENGNSVPMRIRVPSPMSAKDRVVEIHVFAARNPRPHVATFHLGALAGRAEVSTRVRLAGTQDVTVLAALSGNRFRIAEAPIVVTSGACLDDGAL